MIYEQENEIELILTYKCNWNCEYCCVDTHNKNSISLDELKEKISKVIDGYNVTLSGGEVGLMDIEDIKFVIKELEKKKCKISLNTNGLFLKKYPELAKHFDYVLYHCSEDLETPPDFESASKFKNLDYMLIITDNNFHKLEKYLSNHSDIDFHVVAATKADGGLDVTLSNKNRYKIMKMNFPNISKESIKRLIVKEKNFDSILYI